MSPLAVVSVAPADADRRLHGLFPSLTGGGRSWVEISGGAEDAGELAGLVVRLLREGRGESRPAGWAALATGSTVDFAAELAAAEGLGAVPAITGTVVFGDDPAPAADLVEGTLGGLGRLLVLRPRAEATVAGLTAQLARGDVAGACSAADVIAVTTGRGTALVAGDGAAQNLVGYLPTPGAASVPSSWSPGRSGARSRGRRHRTPAAALLLIAVIVIVVSVRVAGGGGTPAPSPSARPSAPPAASQGAALPSGITLAPSSPHGGPAPSARQSPATAWDPVTGRLVLFGGTGDAAPSLDLADTWTWDGTSWSAQTPRVSPPARFGAVMAPAPGGGVIMVGGMYRVAPAFLPVPLEDTWRWDGATWSLIDTGGLPAPGERAGALVLDPSSSQSGSLLLLTSTPGRTAPAAYTWSGSGWATAHPTIEGPTVRLAAPDPAHHQVLVVAADPSSGVSSTWAWRGGDWARLRPALGVDVDALTAVLATDQRSGAVVLVEAHFTAAGGVLSPATDRGGTWIWDGAAWTQQPGPVPSFVSAFDATSAAVAYPAGALTLVGGNRGSGAYRQAARWDPASTSWQPA